MTTVMHAPVDFQKSFMKFKRYMTLSDDEKRFLAELTRLNNDSVWGVAIKSVIADYSIEKFRQLVCQLMSQQHDDAKTMEAVLGKRGSDLLKKLRPCHI